MKFLARLATGCLLALSFFAFPAFAASDVDFMALMREMDPNKEYWSMTTKYPGRYNYSDINNVVDGTKNTDWQTGSGNTAQYMTEAFIYTISPSWNETASFIPKSYSLEFTQTYSPLSIAFYGSNVVTKAWDKLHVVTVEDGLRNVTLSGEFENTMHYRTYRIDVLKTRAFQGNYFYFAEFHIKGDYSTTENLVVTASPVECGEVEPQYGNNSGVQVGQTIACRAPAEWAKADGTLKAVCKGYTLSNIVYNADGIFENFTHVETEENVNEFTYVHSEGAGSLLTWLWECSSRVNLTSDNEAGGSVEVTVDGRVIEPGEYIKGGSTIHVKATPKDGFHFIGWNGVLADESFRTEAEFDHLMAVKHFDAKAQFLPDDDKGLIIYIAPNGDDNNEGLIQGLPKATIENAYATVVAALDAAGEGYRGEIRVLPGEYKMQTRELLLDRPVTITGCNGARDEIILRTRTDKDSIHGRHFIITGDAIIANLTMADGFLGEGSGDNVNQYDSNGGSIKMSSGLVTNCVIRDSHVYYYGGGIYLEGNPDNPPRVVDCLFKNCSAARHGAKGWAVAFRGGTDATTEKPVAAVVERCRILDSKTTWYSYSAVFMDLNGAVLRDTEISGVNWGERTDYNKSFTGGGLYLSKGLVDRCIITNCVRETDAVCPEKGGGVFIKGGILHNCLIAGNDALNRGGGVYAEGGTLINNTIADNFTVNAESAGLYINGSSVIAVNNILAHNQQNGISPLNNVAFGGLNTCSYFDYNVLSPESALDATRINASKIGANNRFGISFFENHETKPYSYKLSATSPAIDTAATIEQLRETGKLNSVLSSIPFLNLEANADISGETGSRPLQGLASSGSALPDVGCYEANDYRNQPLSCSFTQDRSVGVIEIPLERRDGSKEAGEGLESLSVPVIFTVGLNGGGTTAESAADGSFKYRWTIYDRSGEAVYTSDLITNSDTFTYRFGFGEFDVELYAENIFDSTQNDSYRLNKAVRVAGPTAYVNPNGKNIAPYWNWEDGAHYLSDAYNALVTDSKLKEGSYCVLVTNGTHYIKGALLSVNTSVEIKSVNGAEVTIIEAHGADDPKTQEKATLRRIIRMEHKDAILDGFTLTDAVVNTPVAAAAELRFGTIKNCIITGNKTSGNTHNAIAGIEMSGGFIENCVFTANDAIYAYQYDALYMTGGVVSDCIFTNSLSHNWRGVVSVGGAGLLKNSIIANNTPPGFEDGTQLGSTATGLHLVGGTAVNCIITNNTALSSQGTRAAGVYMTSGTLRGCYISGNNAAVHKKGTTSTLYICYGAGLYQENGIVENCTIINNGLEMGTGNGAFIKSGEAFKNNIVAGNGLTNLFFEVEAAANIVTTSCLYPGEVGDATYGNGPYASVLTAAGKGNKLEDPKLLGNGTPRLSSPCVNAGTYQTWMDDAFDLFGTKRIRGKGVDIGALECAKSIGTLIILK